MHVEFKTESMSSDDRDLFRFQDCFARNGSPKDLDRLKWMYGKSQGPRATFAFDVGGSDPDYVAGIYSVLPIRFRIAANVVDAVQSLDTMTDFRYRKRGLFVQLARQSFQRCKDAGARLIYGFPNGNSAHGFFSNLSWTSLDPVPFLIKPLRLRYFLKRAPVFKKIAQFIPDFPLSFIKKNASLPSSVREFDRFTSSFDALWVSFIDVKSCVGIERDAAYLNWRFVDKPGEFYRKFGFFDESGHPLAFIVFALKQKHGGQIGYVMELLHSRGHEKESRALLKFAVGQMAAEKCDAVLAWCLDHSRSRAAFASQGFWLLPERLRPIELHFGVLALDSEVSEIIKKRSNWYLSYADSDTV